MGIGTFVRQKLGPLEIPAANLYRAAFVNLRSLADRVERFAPAERILEVGCGDGCLGAQLLRVYPDAEYVGIDIAPTAGRLYRGDAGRATFRTITVQDFVKEGPEPFDLVVLVDVVHHVSQSIREEVLDCSASLVRPGGYLMVKEFERNRGPYYWLTYAADRYLTGDKGVSFLTLPQVRSLVGSLEGFGTVYESRVPPAHNNVLLARQRHRPTGRLNLRLEAVSPRGRADSARSRSWSAARRAHTAVRG